MTVCTGYLWLKGLRRASSLPCCLRQAQALLARNQLATVRRRERSGTSFMQYREEGDSVQTHDMSTPSLDYSSSSPNPSMPPIVSVRQVHSGSGVLDSNPGAPSSFPAPSSNKDIDNLVGAFDSHLDTQRHRRSERIPHIQQLDTSSQHAKKKLSSHRRSTLRRVLLTSHSPEQAWASYQELMSHQTEGNREVIPFGLLHRLVRLLASIKPRTRTVHLRLLSVLTTMQKSGGQVRLWEWNALLDSVGKNWRKTRLEDYEAALEIFNNMGGLPATEVTLCDEVIESETRSSSQNISPDIWTYNILLSIAIRSNIPKAVRHASSLLRQSGLAPNRYTHLSFLRYFAAQNDLASVRSTLHRMEEQGLELGPDGMNACLWAYARNGHFDVALRIYRILRSNIEPRPDLGDHDINADSNYLIDAGLRIPAALVPDEITYISMVQALAYHGNLTDALNVFVDMLSTPNGKVTPTGKSDYFEPSLTAFRGLFLGFSRHAREPKDLEEESIEPSFSQTSWDLDTLEMVFSAFLQLPADPKPRDSLIYWILIAFKKTSGGDNVRLREVWEQLEEKYGGGWRGRLEDFRESIFASKGQQEEG